VLEISGSGGVDTQSSATCACENNEPVDSLLLQRLCIAIQERS
jgi:hypothetical protein